MNIGIIGSGKMATALGKQWASRGHSVMLSYTRDLRKLQTLVESIGANARAGTAVQAAQFGEVVLLAVPWRIADDALAAAGTLDGKIVIDCTNPFTADHSALMVGHTTSGSEELAKKIPGAKVVKSFNYLFAQFYDGSITFGDERSTMFYCGDDENAKRLVAQLIVEIGFEPVDAGALKMARALEALTVLVVELGYGRGLGTGIALKLLRKR